MRGDDYIKNANGQTLREWKMLANWPEELTWQANLLWIRNVKPYVARDYLDICEILKTFEDNPLK